VLRISSGVRSVFLDAAQQSAAPSQAGTAQ